MLGEIEYLYPGSDGTLEVYMVNEEEIPVHFGDYLTSLIWNMSTGVDGFFTENDYGWISSAGGVDLDPGDEITLVEGSGTALEDELSADLIDLDITLTYDSEVPCDFPVQEYADILLIPVQTGPFEPCPEDQQYFAVDDMTICNYSFCDAATYVQIVPDNTGSFPFVDSYDGTPNAEIAGGGYHGNCLHSLRSDFSTGEMPSLGDSFTLEFFFKGTADNQVTFDLSLFRASGGSNPLICWINDGALSMYQPYNCRYEDCARIDVPQIFDNNWHHIVFQVEGTDLVTFLIDDEVVFTGVYSLDFFGRRFGSLKLSAYSVTDPVLIDEIRLSSTARYEVDEAPVAKLSGKYQGTAPIDGGAGCGFKVKFSMEGSTSGASEYALDFGDGETQTFSTIKYGIDHTYSEPGVFNVTLSVCEPPTNCESAEMSVYVSDFQFGVDNHSFANDNQFDAVAKDKRSILERIRDEIPVISQKKIKKIAIRFGKENGFCSGFAATEADYYYEELDIPCDVQPGYCDNSSECSNAYDLRLCNDEACDDIVDTFTWSALKQLEHFVGGTYANVSSPTEIEGEIGKFKSNVDNNGIPQPMFLSLSNTETIDMDDMWWHAVLATGLIDNGTDGFELIISNNVDENVVCGSSKTKQRIIYDP